MRDILFRGKRVDNQEWVYGFYYCLSFKQIEIQDHFIINEGGLTDKVIPESVGQFTGLTDKNGTKIFEGDILSNESYLFEVELNVQQGKWSLNPFKSFVKDEELFMTALNYQQLGNGYYSRKDLKVIGNIHDNTELLEK